MNPILVGVFLVHMISMNDELIAAAQSLTDFESQLVSYQRCLKVLEIPQEGLPESRKEIESWPSEGNIEFRNFSLKYRPTTEKVLKDLSFSIQSGEKIGVIGRTGAGKSTLCLALCRIIEAHEG